MFFYALHSCSWVYDCIWLWKLYITCFCMYMANCVYIEAHAYLHMFSCIRIVCTSTLSIHMFHSVYNIDLCSVLSTCTYLYKYAECHMSLCIYTCMVYIDISTYACLQLAFPWLDRREGRSICTQKSCTPERATLPAGHSPLTVCDIMRPASTQGSFWAATAFSHCYAALQPPQISRAIRYGSKAPEHGVCRSSVCCMRNHGYGFEWIPSIWVLGP